MIVIMEEERQNLLLPSCRGVYLMSIPLVEALRSVDLQTGRTYRCEVNGLFVELRVLEAPPRREAPPILESDIMLDAWTELPELGPGVVGRSVLGEPDPPDIPEMPSEEVSSFATPYRLTRKLPVPLLPEKDCE